MNRKYSATVWHTVSTTLMVAIIIIIIIIITKKKTPPGGLQFEVRWPTCSV